MKTYTIHRLYHKHLKPQSGTPDMVGRLLDALIKNDFVMLVDNFRYQETDKMKSHVNKQELFKLIGRVCKGAKDV